MSSTQEDPMDVDNESNDHRSIIELDDSDDSEEEEEEDRKLAPSRVRDHNQVATDSPDNSRRRRRRVGSLTAQTANLPPPQAVINLVDSPSPVARPATSSSNNNNNNNNNSDEWACPQCTLLNPATANFCDACHYRNPNSVRPPDSSFRDQLIPDNDFTYSQTRYGNPTNPALFLSGGALLGGMMGAAGSFMNGRPVLESAAEGAMTGAVSGAFVHQVFSSAQQDEMAAARSSAAMGLAGYPSMSMATNSYDDDNEIAPQTTVRLGGRARPRASYRAYEERDPITGATTTVVQAGSSTTRITRRTTRSSTRGVGGGGMTDPLLSVLVHSYLQEGRNRGGIGMGHLNPDNMNYEELLQAFGNGNDNMGASEGDIRALPCKKIENPEKELPEEARECLICLEDFDKGSVRMTLPCLHGFHKECAQKWLRTNGSCPICKHKINATR